MADVTSTRRGILGAIAGVPLAATFGAIPLPAMASTGEWRSAVAAYKRADTAAKEYNKNVFKPAREAYHAKVDAIPHVGSEFTDITGMKYPMSTRDEWAVRMARKELASKKTWHPDDSDYRDYCQTIADGADWRAAEKERIAEDGGFNAIWQQMEGLDEAAAAALDFAFSRPAVSLHELHEKMEMIADRDGFDVDDWTQAILADIRRLAAH